LEKGFFLVGGKEWTCYRRNYFQAAGAFSLNTESSALENQRRDSLTERSLMDASNTGNSWVELEPGHFHPIIGYRLGINAQVADDGGTHVELVQHTTKRDKGPQCIPIPQPILPGGSLDNSWLQLMMAEELARNGKQHQQQQQDDHQPLSEILMTGEDLNGSDNNHYCKPARVQDIVSFDRLQFRSATANNGKRRTSQQYFALSFNLFADIRNEDGSIGSHLIARSLSVPLVVRGRSPSHYNDSPYSSMSSGQSTTHQPNLPAFRNCQPPQPPLESFSAAAANQQMLGGGPLSADCLMMSSSSNNYHRFSPMTQSAMAMPLSPYSARPYRSPLEPLISSSQLPTLNSPSSSSDSSALNDNSNNGGNNLLQPFTSIMSKLDITLADGPNNKSSVSTLMMKVTLTPEQVSPPTAGLYNDEQLWF
jgi:meiosis-specific transcription factor NDT80